MNSKYKVILSLILALTMVMGGVASAASMAFYDVTEDIVYNSDMIDAEIDKLIEAVANGNEIAKFVGGKLVNYEDYRLAIAAVIMPLIDEGKTAEEIALAVAEAIPGIIEELDPVEGPKVPVEELTVVDVSDITDVELKLGTTEEEWELVFPSEITLELSDGTTVVVPVTAWIGENFNTDVADEYTIIADYNLPEGVIGEKKEATFKVIVAEAEADLKVIEISAINPTTITVEFNKDVPAEALEVANFTLSKGTLESVTATGAVAKLNVKGLKYGEVVTVGVVSPAFSKTVTIPEVSELFNLEITTDAEGDTIKSDGAAKMQIQVELKDKLTGETVKKDGILQFTATDGGLGQTTSALQNGKAYVQLTSIASPVSVTSIVTATVSNVPGAEEFKGLVGQKSVFFTPDGASETVEFVRPMVAESTQGDRFHVQFSGNVKAADYKAAIVKNYAPIPVPANGYGVEVDGQKVNIVDIVNVTNDTLEFILDVDLAGTFVRIESSWTPANNNYLRDNVEHEVTFPAKIGKVVLDDITGIKFILTDTSRPAVLGVTAKDQLEFTVRFTETVDRRTVEAAPENFLIDGKGVIVKATPSATDVADAKAANKVIVTSLTVGKYWRDKVAVDERNLVTFVMHKDFALANGAHQIQIAKVGDYAQDVDPAQNIVATDTFDFEVEADIGRPVPTIIVQSPEQWRVEFDRPVYGVSSTSKKIEDVFKIVSADSNDEFVMGTDYMVSTLTKSGKAGAALTPSALASTISKEQYFLIEFLEDWTVKYDTKNNPLKTYFASTKNPYVVSIDNLESAVGTEMVKKDLNVSLAYDGLSPDIKEAYQMEDRDGNLLNTVFVQMTEPVKNVQNNKGGLKDTLTPSQQQTIGTGVPEPTYEFVKGDKVVEGEVESGSEYYDNQAFVLKPVNKLEAGTWTLYIRSISDDIGNTSATVSRQLVIVEAEAEVTDTQIAWAAFDDADGSGKLLFDTTAHDDKDVLYVKFTKPMKSGGANGVGLTQNYVFMGQPLPHGSQVLRGIKGVTKNWDGVTIVMPAGTWDGTNSGDDFTVALNIASNFVAADGEKLSGAYEIELFDTATISINLNNAFEAYYKGIVSTTFDAEAAIIGAEAQDTDGNGKIDTIVLKLDAEDSSADLSALEIYVNGKLFVEDGNGNFTFEADDEEITGTASDGIKITALDGSVIVDTTEVEDGAGPQVISAKAANLDTGDVFKDGSTITITFSEAIDRSIITAVADWDAITGDELDAILAVSSDEDASSNTIANVFGDGLGADYATGILSADGKTLVIKVVDAAAFNPIVTDLTHYIYAITVAGLEDAEGNQAVDLSSSTDLTDDNNVQIKK